MDLFVTPIMCLALTVYHEARNQSTVGQLAVAQVVMNRVSDDRFPDDVCAVVKQGIHWQSKPARNMCQFSFYCDGMSDEPRNLTAFQYAYEIADATLDGYQHGLLEGSTHYHADYVHPDWANHHTRIVQIDNHIFYRWD
jgi:spore germination cell wall hydrolase CwlJ-like protein